MSELENLITELFTVIDYKDAKDFGGFLSDDVEFRFGNLPPVMGRKAAVEFVSQFFKSLDSLSHTLEDIHIDGYTAVCHGSVIYTRHNKSQLSAPFSNWFYFNNKEIARYLIFTDNSAL